MHALVQTANRAAVIRRLALVCMSSYNTKLGYSQYEIA
jgi:hypothetical protein